MQISEVSIARTQFAPFDRHRSKYRVYRDPTPVSRNMKVKRSRILAVVLGSAVGICALAALGIGLYFLISTNIKATSTTITSTTSSKHYLHRKLSVMNL